MTDSLLQISSIWILILIALAIIVVLVLVILSGLVKRSAAPSAAVADEAPDTGAGPPVSSPLAPARSGESASSSFAAALSFLRSSVGGSNFRYQIPWYLVLGESQSGKSALMTSAGVDLAHESLSGKTARRALEWRFLDNGILIAPSGSYIRGVGQEWGKLLRLFQNNRPRRPLDGIVLTIPVGDLVGPDSLDEAELAGRAARISEMLSQAQKVLGFSFPVYVFVTKCDHIEGFSDFCRELPTRTDEEMFGWSSPYHLDASFTGDWVDEAFQHVSQDLQRLQSEVFVEREQIHAPDRVFLFPEEFGRLRNPLRLYLDRLFRESAYRESFRFRGLYFCGDIADIETYEPALMPIPSDDMPPELLAEIPAPAPAAAAAPKEKRPAYVRQVFERKIFGEVALARPLSNVFLARSRSVLAIQVVAAVLAVLLLFGGAWNYRRLRADAAELTPVLEQMERMPQTRAQERHNLLLQMAPAGNVRLKSIFLPASLFSTLDDDVTNVMAFACNRWILTNLHDSLQRKANQLVAIPPPAAGPQSDPGSGSDGTDDTTPAVTNVQVLPEYQELDRFMTELGGLQDARATYEGLRQRGNFGDSGALRKLVAFLYGASLGEYEPNGHFARALTQAYGPPLDITPDLQDRASDRLKHLADAVFARWFGESVLISDVEQLESELGALERGNITTHDGLKNLLAALNQVESDFRSPEFRWVANSHLDLSGPFRRVFLDPLATRANPYFRADTLDYIKRSGDDALGNLRSTLTDQRTAMSGPLLDMTSGAGLSKGTKDLEVALENALNLPFMTVTGTRPIAITLDVKSQLRWRSDPLQEGLRLMDIYQRFVSESLRDAPSRVQPVLGRVALDQMRRHVQNLIAESQDIRRRTESSEEVGAEDETLAEATNFREVSDPHGPLLEMASRFGQLGVAEVRNSIMRILVLQSYDLLTLLDARLTDEDPYVIKEGNFGWWSGKGTLSLDAYQVHSAAELGDYLNTRRDRIKFLVQQAEPLVTFLNTWLPTRGEAQSRLITKWQRLVADYKQYDGKKPGASLAALEDFILTRMDKITPDDGCKDPEPEGDRGLNQDYFQTIRSTLRTQIVGRCRAISAEGVYSAYTQIADLFNSTLAGKFPFGPLNGGKTTSQAPQEAVTDFYALLDRSGKAARSTLKEDTRFGESASRALQFLDQVERLRPLVVPGSPDAEKEPPFTFDFIPHFRTNQGAEIGGNQIIEWVLQVGGQLFRQREPDHPGRWRPGNPVRLSLRWANDSIFLPTAEGQSDVRIRDRNAFVEFTDRWSLLSFLRRHEAAPSEIRQPADPQVYVLKFALKMTQDPKWVHQDSDPAPGTTVVFMTLRLSTPGGKTPLVLPPFPSSAPRLTAPANLQGAK